jgi:DNA modification methylase
MSRAPGSVRDSIITYLENAGTASVGEIQAAVAAHLGSVAPSSVRSYLNLNTPNLFERTEPGSYRLKNGRDKSSTTKADEGLKIGQARLVVADCFNWLASVEERSLHAVVTDPPYGGIEYTLKEQTKLRNGNKGGVWRIPPSFDGHQRAPLPRFTTLGDNDREALRLFFRDFGKLVLRATVPGANIVVASNPLLVHLVADAMAASGLEPRGYITRLVMTMRGGDRPKNAEVEFTDISVMPRSMFEPWLILRHPLDGRVQDNLRKWKTGGFRRVSGERPFGDVIKSSPTPKSEKAIAPHPSLKPQSFLRAVVRASLPLGKGIVCDPFAGSGSTLAAANAVGYDSVGIEMDEAFANMAKRAIPKLSGLFVNPILP